jgi:hypothetical protein
MGATAIFAPSFWVAWALTHISTLLTFSLDGYVRMLTTAIPTPTLNITLHWNEPAPLGVISSTPVVGALSLLISFFLSYGAEECCVVWERVTVGVRSFCGFIDREN